MKNFVICTDSACDISSETLKEWGVRYLSLTFRFNTDEKEFSDDEMDIKTFYDKMREGGVAKTAAVNSEGFMSMFEEILKDGNDVLYIGFSSGLSTTFNSARIAGEELSQKYPERNIMIVDSLCASAGEGLLVYLALEKQKNGGTIEEVCAYVKDLVPHICHWFTVDDLVYLKRGGRISPALAFAGNLLGLKPLMHVDNDGHLVNVGKIRGRKKSIEALADKYGENALDLASGTVFISHGDCLSEAEELASIIKSRYGASVSIITNVGAVIGAHSGPGTMALFFVGKER